MLGALDKPTLEYHGDTPSVELKLSPDEALVLFEFVSRSPTETPSASKTRAKRTHSGTCVRSWSVGWLGRSRPITKAYWRQRQRLGGEEA
jgi:hypothetical protein